MLADGRMAGSVTSCAWVHRVDASLALAWLELPEGVTRQSLAAHRFAVDAGRGPVPVEARLGCFYDPGNARVRPPG